MKEIHRGDRVEMMEDALMEYVEELKLQQSKPPPPPASTKKGKGSTKEEPSRRAEHMNIDPDRVLEWFRSQKEDSEALCSEGGDCEPLNHFQQLVRELSSVGIPDIYATFARLCAKQEQHRQQESQGATSPSFSIEEQIAHEVERRAQVEDLRRRCMGDRPTCSITELREGVLRHTGVQLDDEDLQALACAIEGEESLHYAVSTDEATTLLNLVLDKNHGKTASMFDAGTDARFLSKAVHHKL